MTRKQVHLAATGVSAVAAIGAAAAYFSKSEAVKDSFTTLGYPDYFPPLLGSFKLLGAAALLTPVPPQAKEWAYAGFAFTYVSACVSHVARREPTQGLAPLATLAVLWASYTTRDAETAKLV